MIDTGGIEIPEIRPIDNVMPKKNNYGNPFDNFIPDYKTGVASNKKKKKKRKFREKFIKFVKKR